ncbi:hypothetical protein QBC43DRAFT_283216 [Cladorrhinum sp. PSN259]|nr:hypothetical protein QBC43DRAFT_283216 [Cladorrhinum sp. PSN259]
MSPKITTLLTLLATSSTLTLALIPPSLPQITPAPVVPLGIRQENTSFPTTTSVAPFVDGELLVSCSSAYTSLENSNPNVTNSALSSWFDSLEAVTFPPLSAELDTASAISSWCTAIFESNWNLPPPSSLNQAYVEYAKATASWEGANAAKATSLASACAVQDKELAADALMLVASDQSNCVTAWSVQFGLASVPTVAVTTTSVNGGNGNGGQQGGGQGGQGGQQSGTRTVSTSKSSAGAGGVGPRETGFVQAVMAFAAAGAVVGAAL